MAAPVMPEVPITVTTINRLPCGCRAGIPVRLHPAAYGMARMAQCTSCSGFWVIDEGNCEPDTPHSDRVLWYAHEGYPRSNPQRPGGATTVECVRCGRIGWMLNPA